MKLLKSLPFIAVAACLIGCGSPESKTETIKTDPGKMSEQQKAVKDGLSNSNMPDAARKAAGG